MKVKDYRDLKVWRTGMRQSLPCHYGVVSPTVIARSMSDEAISVGRGVIKGLPRGVYPEPYEILPLQFVQGQNDRRRRARNDIVRYVRCRDRSLDLSEVDRPEGLSLHILINHEARMLATLISRLGKPRAPSDERPATSDERLATSDE